MKADLQLISCAEQPPWNPLNFHTKIAVMDAGGYGCPFQKTSDFYGFVASKFRCWPIPKWSPQNPSAFKKNLSAWAITIGSKLRDFKIIKTHISTPNLLEKSPSATVVSPSKLGIQTQRFTTQRHFPLQYQKCRFGVSTIWGVSKLGVAPDHPFESGCHIVNRPFTRLPCMETRRFTNNEPSKFYHQWNFIDQS